ncbi:MAG TPA: hypothetical protein VD930_00655 [Gemmatimonadales bacterium]|nr:hypothetical protein [Gemmatimonadales bacterium]
MRVREFAWVVLLIAPHAVPSTGWTQATKDQARLVFTVSGGFVGGRDLWAIDAQPIQFTDPIDTVALGRRIRSTLGIAFAGAYFPGDNLGFGLEGFLVGLGFEDRCRVTFSSGSTDLIESCQSIQGATKSATAVAVTVGPIFRVNSRSLISPYARANVGLVFSNQSSLRTTGRYLTPDGFSTLIVYDDDHETRVEPALAFGFGFTAAVARGYQLRWEVRDNIVGVQEVTSAPPQARVVPPHDVTYKHLLSVTIGFDVVLERRRGRRY